MSNLEQQFISKLVITGDFESVTENQINLRFLTGKNKRAFTYITRFITNYGKVPSKNAFKLKFPDYEIVDSPETMHYYCDELRKKLRHNTLADAIEEVGASLEDLETEEAYKAIIETINFLDNHTSKTDRREINKDTNHRLELYRERANSGGITGIPSGIDRMDRITTGFNKEDLIILLAFTGVGKTWFEAICAVLMAKMGYKVLFFTTEMSSDGIMKRIDAVWCNLNYTRFTQGKLTDAEYKRFTAYLSEMEGNEDFNLIIEQVNMGATEISSKIDQHKPDMVFVDGAYLLEDEGDGEDDWRAQVRIFRSLKRIARAKKVPIFASTQSKSEKANLSSIAFASHIRADADIILGLQQDEEMRHDKEIAVAFLKLREGEINSRVLLNWKFSEPNGMNYSTIYAENSSGAREKDDLEHSDEVSKVRDINKSVMVVE